MKCAPLSLKRKFKIFLWCAVYLYVLYNFWQPIPDYERLNEQGKITQAVFDGYSYKKHKIDKTRYRFIANQRIYYGQSTQCEVVQNNATLAIIYLPTDPQINACTPILSLLKTAKMYLLIALIVISFVSFIMLKQLLKQHQSEQQ